MFQAFYVGAIGPLAAFELTGARALYARNMLPALREAKVEVKEIPGKPGSYNAVAYLRPWLQMEELTTSMRMVARIPQKS